MERDILQASTNSDSVGVRMVGISGETPQTAGIRAVARNGRIVATRRAAGRPLAARAGGLRRLKFVGVVPLCKAMVAGEKRH